MASEIIAYLKDCSRRFAELKRSPNYLPIKCAIARTEGDGGSIGEYPLARLLRRRAYLPSTNISMSDNPVEIGYYSEFTQDLECVTRQLQTINEVAKEANRLLDQLPSRVRSRMLIPPYANWWRLVFHLCWHFPRPFLNAHRIRLVRNAHGVESTMDENFVHFFGAHQNDVCPGIIFSQIEHDLCSTSEAAIDAIVSLVEECEQQERHWDERLTGNGETRKAFTELQMRCRALAKTPGHSDCAAIIKTASIFEIDAIPNWSPFRFGGKNERFPLLSRYNEHVEYGYICGSSTSLIWGIAERYGPMLPWGYRPGFSTMFDHWRTDDRGRSGTAIYGPAMHRNSTEAFIGFVFFTLKNNRHPLINVNWCTEDGPSANGYATIVGNTFEAIATAIELAGLCEVQTESINIENNGTASTRTKSPADSSNQIEHPETDEIKDAPFVPNELQEEVLEALNGKSFILTHLAERLRKNQSQLHRDALRELLDLGIVMNEHRFGGYYRPDAPPEKVAKYSKLGAGKSRATKAQSARK